MLWVIGAICAFIALFAWTLCKAAGDASRREEAYWAEHGMGPDDAEFV